MKRCQYVFLVLKESECAITSQTLRYLANILLKNSNFNGVYELDKASKCLALSRPTACVFHLMRVIEIGIRAISKCLKIPGPIKPADRNWGKMLCAIKGGIENKWPTVSNRTSGDGALFDAIYVSLDAVKNPWRNSTMHVENKYTEDEAEHVFVAVRGFMMKLASRMDEQGLPLA